MRGRSHVIISSLMCQTVSTALFKDYTLIPAIVGGIYATIPDIDHFNSIITNRILKCLPFRVRKPKLRKVMLSLMLFALSTIIAGITANPYLPLIALFTSYLALTKHRRLSHSLLSNSIFGLLSVFGFGILIGFYAFYGYFMHLMEDLITYGGVPLLYPFSKKKYRIPIIKVDSFVGNLIENVLIGISVVVFTYGYR